MKNFNLIEMAKAMKEHKLRHMWRYAAMIFAVLVMSIANIGMAWGEDITITPIYTGSYLSPGNLVKVTMGSNTSVSSGNIQVNKETNGSFTISTSAPGMYLKSATFTDTQNGSNKAITNLACTNGSITNSSGTCTYTASASTTSTTISFTGNTGGTAKLGSLQVTVTNGSLNNMETLSGFSCSSGTYSFTAKINNSTVTSAVSLTTQASSSWGASDGNISIPSSNDSKTLTITSSNNIRYVAILDNNCRLALVEKSSTGGTCDGASWTAPSKVVNTVTFKNGISTSLTATKVFVITEAAGGGCGETAQAALSLSSSSGSICGTGTATFTVSGGSGSGALSVSSSDETKATASIDGSTVTVTGVAAGSATITVTKACDATYAEKTATYSATVAAVPTANAGVDKVTEPGTGVALAATAAADGCTGAWTIQSGPNTATSQLSSTSSATATFTPTAAGTYTLRWTVTNTSSSCSAYDEMTVKAAICSISDCGNATLTYPLNVGTSLINTAANLVNTPSNGGSAALTVPAASAAVTLSTITISDKDGKNDNYGKAAATTSACYPTAPTMSSKIGMYNGSSYSSSNYLQFVFTVNSGYTFTPCDIQFTVQPVSHEASFRWEVTDGTNIYGYGVATDIPVGSSGGASVMTGLTSTTEMAAGDYYIRLYPYYNGSNTFRISNNVILKGTTAAAAPACTAADHVDISGEWAAFIGYPISLTATAYDDEDNAIETGLSYQWYKDGTADGNMIDGATSATYYKASAELSDYGSYYCKVSKAGCSDVFSSAYGIKIMRIHLMWEDGTEVSDYAFHNFAPIGDSKAVCTIALEGYHYSLQVLDGQYGWGDNNNAWFSRSNYWGTTASPWTHGTVDNKTFIDCDIAGDYVFTLDYSSGYKMGVMYPQPTYYYKGNDDAWSSTHEMTKSCDGTYAYFWTKGATSLQAAGRGTNNNNFLIMNAAGNITIADGNKLEIRDGEATGFGGTDIWGSSNMGKWDGSTNASIYNAGDFYIVVYYPNNSINTTNDPKICASTKLPGNATTADEVVYFEKPASNWGDKAYYRIGHRGTSSAPEMELVPGTARLYQHVLSEWTGYEAWSIANNSSWQGSNNSIYKVDTGDEYDITKSTNYFKCETDGNITIILDDENYTADGCTFYNVNTYSGMLTHTATVSDMTNGSVRLNWTDVNDAAQSATSTTSDLAHTCNLQITGVPATGYDVATLTVNGSNFTSGDTHVLSADATIAATFALHNYNVTYSAPSNGNYTIKVADGTASSASKTATYGQTVAIVATPADASYEFTGWTVTNTSSSADVTSALLAGDKATTASTSFTMPAYDVTIVATFAKKTYTVTYNKGTGDITGSHANDTKTYGVNLTLPGATFSKTGYTQTGWATEEGGSKVYELSGSYTANAAANLYPVWTAKTTAITLEAGEGGTDGSATATYGTNTITDYVAATRTGYTLGNYYQDGSKNNILTKEGELNSGDKGSILDDGLWVYDGATITLYAQWTAIEYTIAYNLAGGSVASPNPISYTIESSAITLNNPTKTGYTFAGWTGTGLAEATTAVTIAAGSTGNRSYTATWTPIVPSSVSLKASTTITVGGTETLTATITPAVVADNTITWTSSDETVATVTSAGVVTGVKAGTATITATTVNDKTATCEVTVAPAVTYTVTYEYNGADGGSRPENATGASVSLPNPTKTGYTLQGWYTSSGSLAGAATATYNPTSNITLYALWREDACAGGGGGGSTTLFSTDFTESGWSSLNNTETAQTLTIGGHSVYVRANETQYLLSVNTSTGTLTWGGRNFSNKDCYLAIPVAGVNGSLTITVGNGSSETRFGYAVVKGSVIANPSTNTNTSSANPSVCTVEDLDGTSYVVFIGRQGSSNTQATSISITTPGGGSGTCYYVTYNGNGADGGFTKDEASHPSGSDVTVASNSFTKTGYTFTGWKTEPSGGTSYAAGGTISGISGNMTLYAQWEEEEDETTYYLVTSTAQLNTTDTYIIANSAGTAVMSTTTADTNKNPDDITSGFSVDGSTLTVTSASPNLFKLTSATNGWLFKGGNGSGNYLSSESTPDEDLWYNTSSTPTNNTGEWAVSFAGGIATMKLGKATETTYHIYYDATNTKFIQSTTASNIKIYTSNSTPVYTVTYANGGATSGSVPTDTNSPYEEGATVTVLGNTGSLVKNGYTFAGWNDGSTDYEADDTFTMPDENVTLTAQWTPNTYDITYNLNGASWAGGYSAPANYTVGTGATLPVAGNMTNTGYTFNGWYANPNLSTGGVKTEISTSDYGNKEFWAKWTENTYTITYDNNNGSATGSTAATEGHYVTVASCGFELDGYLFTGWNTKSDGTGESYGAGEDIELTANMTLYAQWATDYTITWGNVQIGGAGETVKPNLGGGNYTITANTGSWTGSLDASMISSETSGVTITKVAVSNGGSPKTITVTFAVGAEVVGESIGLTLSVPAAGVYSAKSDTKAITIDRCTGSGGGSDGVLFSAEFKDSGLGTSNICDAANDSYTFTTAELKSAPTGGSIKAYTTSNLSHMKYATNAISIAGSDGVIQIDLSNAIATNDLFTYLNVNSSTSSAYLRHTSPTTTTDQIALTVYNSKEAKVRLTSGFNGKTTLYIVRNNSDFKLHKAAVVRPAFLMLLRDDTPTSDTNLEGTDAELTTGNYLTTINGGRAYYTSPSSGNLKIKRSSSKNYINFNSQAGYVKIVLNDALQEGDVIGFDSYNTNNLALTTTDVRSTSIVTTNQLYTVGSSSALKDQTTFYLWQNSGSSDYLRGLQIARSGVAGGGGGTDQITTTLSWDPALNTDPDWNSGENRLNKETGDADFTFAAVQDKNSLGALTYSSSNTGVATVTAGGTVHIVGAAGDATITATMAESGCYKGATISYNIHVVDNCDDTPGHVMAYDLGCDGTLLVVVLYDGMDPEAVNYQWYRDGASLGESYRAQRCTVTVAGEYYVVVDNTAAGVGHCAMASDNTVEVEARAGISAEKIVDQWYVKNGRRTPDVELVQTTGATGFVVKIGETTIWNSDGTVTTGFGGCGFRLGENGIIYLNGQADDYSAPDGLSSGDVTLTITAKGCGSDADPLEIEIHCQASTDRKSVAFVVDGTEKGTFAQADADHSTNSALYQFLDYTLSGGSGKFDLTAQNIYSSVDEKELREHYSQFDAIIITDDPSTGKKKDGKSYVNAFGTMIDVRPILTMEAFVSKLANWKAKGINGNPESPSSRQYAMTLQCKDHEIFFGIDPTSPNVAHEEIDGVDYWTVTMVDKTKSPYSSKASDTDDTEGTPALQGFSASDVSGLLLLGEIKNGDKTMYTGVERQEEPAARLMLLGIQNKALPNALTTEGKTIIENAVGYLLKTNMEEVDDCSNYFIGGGGDNSWETNANWFKGKAPNSPMIRVRILAPCEVSTTIHAAHIDIVTSGESSKKGGEMTGQLTIKPNGAVIVGGEVRAAEAPYFNKSDLKPTEEQDLKIETSAEGQGALILNNDAGDTKATVEYYSLGRKDGSVYQFQYFASPMGYLEINPAFAGAGIYTYAWNEAVADGWERRAYYTDVLGFEGLAITTKRDYNSTYNLKGALASTADVDIPLTYTDAGAGGQNLIGNSWTAPINIASLVEAFEDDGNVTKTVNIYNSGNEEYPGLGTAGTWTSVPISVAAWPEWTGLKVIPAMQAFRIDVTSETKLTMNYEKMVRQTESSSLNEPLKAPRRRSNANGASLMRMRLESGNAYTDLFLIEGEQFSEAFDNGYEAKFIAGEDNTVQFYAMNGEEKMAVLATDALEGTQVGFVPGKGTAYTISFSGDGMGYYLNDLKLMTSTLINEEATYSFTFEEGDANRFYISRTPIEAPQTPTGVDNTHSGEVKAQKFIYNGKMYIMINGRVYSADGQIVK